MQMDKWIKVRWLHLETFFLKESKGWLPLCEACEPIAKADNADGLSNLVVCSEKVLSVYHRGQITEWSGSERKERPVDHKTFSMRQSVKTAFDPKRERIVAWGGTKWGGSRKLLDTFFRLDDRWQTFYTKPTEPSVSK